ncbi:2111_t:CDS:10 [Entrophospora sp. SA101]|nr:2111_t:CDS:10 [Entrophospora sp. SA101]
MSENKNNIRVVCRFRPQNSREIREGGVPIISYDDNGETCRMEVNVISGYNGTVFAYGQTGSDMDKDDMKGLIPRIVEQIFHCIIASPPTTEYTVKVSYMEIYMEKIPQNDNLPIHEEKNRGVYVKGLLEVYVSSIEEVYEVMKRGGSSRIVAYTNMNAESSRSHSIFVITVGQKNLADGSVKSGKLSLVDLAGSEKVGKTGASGQTLEEAKKINKSLSALGMVINALTDGKSTHIPYRDSKLTRILQESLGGNSRTTLIINSSPSSFNEAESLSTLRFGMRVNAELSPAELKALLKKAKNEAVTFQQYITALEGEVGVWRKGGNVPKEQWASMDKVTSGAITTASSPTNPSVDAIKKDAEVTDSRPGTPVPILDKDEREEFLRRENELTDQIAEKETILADQEKLIADIKEELNEFKDQMASELNELKLQLEKVTYDNKEGAITVDSLREANIELNNELEALKKSLIELRMAQKEGDKEQKKQEKMAQMLAELDPSGVISAKEKQIRDTLLKLESIDGNNTTTLTLEEITALRRELSNSKSLVEQHEQTINELHYENEHLTRKRDELEIRLTTLELDALADLKRANEELQSAISSQEIKPDGKNVVEKEKDMERIRKTMAQQLSDFDVMKKALMRDLQNRCEKVVELEISLDETREQYNNVLRNSNNKAQQKKMAFLERNLEQLTNVQKQKEVAIAERKLHARNERIQALETLLQDAQEKLTTQNQKFEAQLQAVRERLEQARSQKSNTLALNFGRIAKPLRGGGGVVSMGRKQGKVKFFNCQKGYGFIIPNEIIGDNSKIEEVFVHYSSIYKDGEFKSLAEGEEVEFELMRGPKGFQATNVSGPNGISVRGAAPSFNAAIAIGQPYSSFHSTFIPQSVVSQRNTSPTLTSQPQQYPQRYSQNLHSNIHHHQHPPSLQHLPQQQHHHLPTNHHVHIPPPLSPPLPRPSSHLIHSHTHSSSLPSSSLLHHPSVPVPPTLEPHYTTAIASSPQFTNYPQHLQTFRSTT